MILYLHLATEILFDLLWRWIQYLNRCVVALASEVVEALGDSVPFSLEPILVDLERVRYIGPIPPASLVDLVTGRRSSPRLAAVAETAAAVLRNLRPWWLPRGERHK